MTAAPFTPAELAAQVTALLQRAEQDPTLPCPDVVELGRGPGHTSGTPLIDFDLAGTGTQNLSAAIAWSGEPTPHAIFGVPARPHVTAGQRHFFPHPDRVLIASARAGGHAPTATRPLFAADTMPTALHALADLLVEHPNLPAPTRIWVATHRAGLPEEYDALVRLGFDGARANPAPYTASEQVAAWSRVEQDGLLGRFEPDDEDYGGVASVRLYLLALGVA